MLAAYACLAGCDGDAASIVVDLKTDYVPGADFSTVWTEVSPVAFESVTPTGTIRSADARGGASYVDGVRVAEISPVRTGMSWVRVTLLDDTETPIARRIAAVTLTGSY